MGFGNIGIGELMMILLVVMLVFGPKRMPGIARDMGKFLRDFRRETNAAIKELKEGIDIEEIKVGVFDEPDATPVADGVPASMPGVAAAPAIGVVSPAEALAGDGNGSRPKAKKKTAAKRKPAAASSATRRKTSTSGTRKPASAKNKRATPSKSKGSSSRTRATRKR